MRVQLRALLGSIVIIGLGGLAVWAFIEAVQAEPAVVGSIGAAVAGVFGVLWQQRRSESARLREVHRTRMTPTYEGLLEIIQGGAAEGQEQIEEVARFMKDLKGKQLLLGAPKEMIRAFNTWQETAPAAGLAGDERERSLPGQTCCWRFAMTSAMTTRAWNAANY